jgi:hypothetical protein
MIQATRTALKLSTGTIRPPLMERSTDGWRAGAGDLCRVRLPSTTKLSRAPRITVLSPTGLCPNRRGRNCENAFHEAHVESPLRELSLSALTNREPNNPVVAAMPEEFQRKAPNPCSDVNDFVGIYCQTYGFEVGQPATPSRASLAPASGPVPRQWDDGVGPFASIPQVLPLLG